MEDSEELLKISFLTRRDWLFMIAAGGASACTHQRSTANEGSEDEMILVPAGSFLKGTSRATAQKLADTFGLHKSWLAGEWPQSSIWLASFHIDKYPVTNSYYGEFCRATDYRPPSHWADGEPPATLLDHPVTYVNRTDARHYAEWAGKRLPTGDQWEKAARGPNGRLFPWGDEFDSDACHHDRGNVPAPGGTAPVNAHPGGASPYEVMDMAGNVAEWCDDGPSPDCSYVRGGCWLISSPLSLRCAAKGLSGFDNNRLDHIGFRCVKEG